MDEFGMIYCDSAVKWQFFFFSESSLNSEYLSALEDPKQSMTKMPHEGILTCFLPSPLPKLLIAT